MTQQQHWPDAATFVADIRAPLVGSLALYCGDRAVAEELAQEALARTWERWDRLTSPRGFAYRCAFNLARSALRRRLAERAARQRLQSQAEIGPSVPDTAEALAVRQAVAALPRRQREVVIARYFADLSVAEAATAMGCRPGTVKALTSQAISSLRAAGLLVDEPAEEPVDSDTKEAPSRA